MPRRDGTGPTGQGAGTGRGLGNCQPSAGSAPRIGQSGSTDSIQQPRRNFLEQAVWWLFRLRRDTRNDRKY